MCVQRENPQKRNFLICTSVTIAMKTDLSKQLLYYSFAILVAEFAFVFIVFRRSSTLCFNNRDGIVVFELLAIADTRLILATDRGSLVQVIRKKFSYSSSNVPRSCKRMSTVERTHPSYLGARLRDDKVG